MPVPGSDHRRAERHQGSGQFYGCDPTRSAHGCSPASNYAEIKPRALWVDDEKALFVAWLAVPDDIPLVHFVRTRIVAGETLLYSTWRRVDAALSVSKACLSYLDAPPARARGYAHGNLNVAYSGIDAAATVARAKAEPKGLPARAPGVLRVTFPAVLQHHKGQDIGIRAIAKFLQAGNKVQLLLCGDVPPEFSTSWREQLVELVRDLGVQEHVHMLGWRDDMLWIMARSDVVMLTSLCRGFATLPAGGYDVGQASSSHASKRCIPELVRDGVDGILVESGDINGVVQALHALSESSTREQMGQAGQRRVRESFAPGQQIETFLQVMDSVCETRRRSKNGRRCYVRTPL